MKHWVCAAFVLGTFAFATGATAADLRGQWSMDLKCSTHKWFGIMTLDRADADGVEGNIINELGPSLIKSGSQRGSNLTFQIEYIDKVGNPQTEKWTGALSPNGEQLLGVVTGGWAFGCKWTAKR